MKIPAISIVMPCFNAREYLPASVASVLAQTFADWELIAVDDGSQDETAAWLRGQTDPRIRCFSQPNRGVSAARNAGIAVTRGRFLAFLDADDTWSPEFLQKMWQALKARPDAVLAYCGWQNVGLTLAHAQPYVPPDLEAADNKPERLFRGCQWPVHAALVRRDAAVAAGGFDVTLSNAEDYALWVRVASHAPIVRVPEVLSYYHFHGGTQASANMVRAVFQFMKAQGDYLATRPEFAKTLGRDKIRELTLGTLLASGYKCYWSGDLESSRTIFNVVMKHGYGRKNDWKYLLPALLPLRWYQRIVDRLRSERNRGA